MERLTKWEDDSITYNEKRELECGEYCDSCSQGAGNCKTVKNMIKKLATYEDLEEHGLLVRLPCKLNGTLYSVNYSNKTIAENTIIKISINDHVKRFYCIDDNLRERIFFSRRIGENVFLTREEAEKKLKELKNEI